MSDPYLPGRGDDRYRVAHYDLDLDYRPATNALRGRAVLSLVPLAVIDALALDLLPGLTVDKVSAHGRPCRWRHRGDRVSVTLPAGTGEPFLLEVRWSGSPRPRRGPWGEVGWEELTDGVLVAGQPDGASSWMPCNDLPVHKATWSTRVTTDSAYTVVAHGTLVQRTSSGSRTSWTYEQQEPTATYLATVQVGRYATEPSGTSLLHAPPHLLVRARADLAAQPRMLALFERYFGPYPFPGYSVVVTDDDLEIPLEAQGLTVLGANHVDGRGGSERLVAHELAHQWFGNSLTVAVWQDIWLHEGFACYAEWLWSQEAGRTSTAELADGAHRRQRELPQDLLLADPGPQRMFDDRVYQRGALALHAVRTALGDDLFWDVLRSWTEQHRHGSVSTAQFRAHVGPAGQAALAPWLDETNLPAP